VTLNAGFVPPWLGVQFAAVAVESPITFWFQNAMEKPIIRLAAKPHNLAVDALWLGKSYLFCFLPNKNSQPALHQAAVYTILL